MDKVDSDLVNLYDTQADQTDVTRVHLRTTQEDSRMLEPEVVDRIRELSAVVPGTRCSSGDTIPVRREPCQVLVFSGCNSHPATGSLQPVAIGAAVEVTKPSEPSRQTGRFGDSASRQAVIASER